MSSSTTSCGFWWLGYPQFLQRFANTKTFIFVYGLLGTFQAMGFVYFIITLQTMEKRFKIPSQTTGLILSGNEISQILLSVILAYFGGQRNRPRFIAWGVIFSALSCFILALPHFIYGPGEDSYRLTKEYMEATNNTILDNSAAETLSRKNNGLCMAADQENQCDGEIESITPLVLIFLSQFVLGIGNTLYFALGQTYLDDNTKKKNTPLLLSYAFAFRTSGPAIGFVLAYACLKIYIDPSKTPLIDSDDPRWMGAWWLGWVFLGIALLIVAGLVGLFPKELPKKRKQNVRPISDDIPRALKSSHDIFSEENQPLKSDLADTQHLSGSITEVPTLAQFPAAMKRLFKNKLLMCNILSGIFYILGASAYFTFMSKYMEVQFHRSAADASIITGPVMIFGVVIGLLASGYVITKLKPSPSKLLMWNVIVGIGFMAGQVINLYLTCPDGQTPMEIINGKINLTTPCNSDCHCSGFSYTPVCWEETGDTFFNPCVASCNAYSKENKFYHECECAREAPKTSLLMKTFTPTLPLSVLTSIESSSISFSSPTTPLAKALTPTAPTQSTLAVTSTTTTTQKLQNSTLEELRPHQFSSEVEEIVKQKEKVEDDLVYDAYEERKDEYEYDDDVKETTSGSTTDDAISHERRKRSEDDVKVPWGKLIPGACIKGCAFGFYTFSIVSSIINCFGASGRIGNLLVNYRCVSNQDKSVTQGLILMMISLFALIPGPVLFGRIIDSTCLVWTEQCSGRRGNCQLYDQRLFRYYINLSALCLTSIGVFFDVLVWKFGKNLDLYGEREEEMLKKKEKDSRNGVSRS